MSNTHKKIVIIICGKKQEQKEIVGKFIISVESRKK